MVWIKNTNLKNSIVSTYLGNFAFDSRGMALVPEELADELLKTGVFTLVDENGTPIDTPQTPDEPSESSAITLESGVVWDTINGGYTAEDGDKRYTISGSAVTTDETGVVPSNILIQDGKLYVSSGIDVNNFHVIGVTENETINIGDKTYYWTDADSDTTNGYELAEYIPATNPDDTITPEPQPTLPAGWDTVESGIAYSDDSARVTIQGVDVGETGTVPVTIESGTVKFDEDVDTDNIHVIGVNDGDTLYVGDVAYQWKDTDNNLENGYEIATISSGEDTVKPDDPEPSEPTDTGVVTLPSGVIWETVEGGYSVEDGDTHYTISGSAVTTDETGVVASNISVEDGKLIIASDTDVSNLHVIGVTENETINIGDKTYYWTDVDSDTTNGYELAEYIPATNPDDTITPEPQPTLPAGWSTIESGIAYSDDTAQVTIQGVTAFEDGTIPVTIEGDTVKFDESVNTENIHVIGVNDGDTLYVGDVAYQWRDTDGNLENGYEITTISGGSDTVKPDDPEPPPSTDTGVITLPSGAIWETVEGGYSVEDGDTHYTISGSAVTTDETGVVASNISVEDGKLIISSDTDVSNLHVIGVTENETINIGYKIYYWTDADSDTTNGYELAEYIPATNPDDTITPEPKPTLPAGWSTVEGGLAYSDDTAQVTIHGAELAEDGTLPLVIEGTTLKFGENTDTENIHVIGVNEGDTLYVGDVAYKWEDIDDNLENGYEIATISSGEDTIPAEPTDTGVVTLPSGVIWETVEGGYSVEDGDTHYTISGSAVIPDETGVVPSNISVENGQILISSDTDITNLHVIGVTENETINVGDKTYYWTDADSDTTNGYELAEYIPATNPDDTITPEPQPTLPAGWDTVEGGISYSDDSAQVTIQGVDIAEDGTIPVTIEGDTVKFDENVDTENIHVVGVNDGDTLYVGDVAYQWKDTDNNLENGYEIATIGSGEDTVKPDDPEPSEPTDTSVVTLPSGVIWETIEGGYSVKDGDTHYTISGSAVTTDETGVVPSNISVNDGVISLSNDIDIANLHVIGVTENETINVGDKTYYWTDADSDTTNGYELAEYVPATNPDDTITPDNPTTDTEVTDGFTYNFDGVNFTLSGGLNSQVTEDDLNENTEFSSDSLKFGENIIANADQVHIQGLNEGTKIEIAGQKFELRDADNNPDNGLEIVGDEAFGWKYLNKSSGKYEPAIWKHFNSANEVDIVVIGCSSRPALEENVLILEGDNLKIVANELLDSLVVAGSVHGLLTKGVGWEDKIGLVHGINTNSHILQNDVLYLPKATITGVTEIPDYKLSGGVFTVISGMLSIPNLKVTGAITHLVYNGKRYYVNYKTGKIVPNAWQRR